MGFIVKYRVLGKACQAGPYDTRKIAEGHRDDIRGYEGVTSVEIEPVEPKSAWDRLLEDK